ncbi:MAG: hypothetical protein Q7V57_01200 [Actinomycetota bacterium]|nr:hypothetical protein [Actinomycetota bacterium]
MTTTMAASATGIATDVMATDARLVRLLFGAAALAVSLTTTLACSDDSGSPSSSAVGTTDPALPVVVQDPAAALQHGLDQLAAGYHMVATVTVNGAVSLRAEGDRVGTSSRLEITSAGATVSYVITPEGNYAKPTDGDWEQLDVTPATSDPIDAMRAPVAVTTVGTTAGGLQLKVTVNAVALGIQVDGNVDLNVTLVDGLITTITYDAAVQGGQANVTTVITALADATPITAPDV